MHFPNLLVYYLSTVKPHWTVSLTGAGTLSVLFIAVSPATRAVPDFS